MERQSTSKLYRALIAVVAFFVLCTSAILFASCGTNPLECKHENWDEGDVVAVEPATCGTRGTVTYKCSDCGAEVTVIGTLATGEHTPDANGKCTVCGLDVASDGITLKEIKDLLAEVATKVDMGTIVEALKEENFTIPALDEKLEKVLDSLQGFDDLNIELDLSASATEFLAETGTTGSVTLADVITALYKQVHQLYTDYASKVGTDKTGTIYNLLVAKDAEGNDHVHNWILKLAEGQDKSCTDPQSYVWGCAFCGATKSSDKFTVQAVGHATDFTYVTKLTNPDEKVGHYFDATCISGARVEGFCRNCGQWTGEWTEVGKPTYQHHYVLENGTDADGHTGAEGSCTSVHENVYHCETCGGAYVEEVAATGHNYYYRMVDGKKVGLTDKEKEDIIKAYWGNTTPTEDQKALALQPYLNVVYSAEATCVDPALVVVECVECGVRYSYTTGLGAPDGHKFVVKVGFDATCTMDGTATYAYCYECGYFFLYDGTDTSQAAVEAKVGKYSRNYIRTADNMVIYLDPETDDYTSEAPVASSNKTEPQALQDLYTVITEEKAATGHTFVPVYTNIEKCVTAQRYVLVCSTCFGVYTGNVASGNKTSSFSTLTTTDANNATALFYQKDGKYWVTGLGDNPETNKTVAATKVATIGSYAVKDDPTKNTAGETATTSDLTAEWNALKAAEDTTDTTKFAWLAAHGYLVRDTRDDGPLPSITRDEVVKGTNKWYNDKGELTPAATTKIKGYLDKLAAANVTVDSLYNNYNVLGKWVPATTTQPVVTAHYEPDIHADLVKGHSFDDYFVTVVGGCTMYERHVYFCSECGSGEGTPAGTQNVPHTVTGSTDLVCAGYKSGVTVPTGFKTDLQLAWEAVKASMDPSAPFLWLAEHGYLNDLRDDMSKPFDADTEMMDLMARATVILLGKDIRECIQLPPEALNDLFTGKNVLEEFTEDVVYKNTDAMAALGGDGEGPAGGLVIDSTTGSYTYATAPLGHTFNAVTYITEVESCDSPADYVYVCSVCGSKANAPKPGAFKYWSGKNEITTGLKQVEKDNQNFVSDQSVFEASVPAARRTKTTTAEAEFTTSDFDKLWLDVKDKGEKAQFDWLLKYGYLNGVIDKFFMDGDVDADGSIVNGGFLAKALADAKKLDSLAAVTQKMYNDARATVYVVGDDDKITQTLKSDYESDILAFAKKLLGTTYVSGTPSTPDLTAYYLKSGDEQVQVSGVGVAANKTLDAAKVTVPASGHLFSRQNGSAIDLGKDPLCLDFASKTLTDHFKKGEIVYWNSTTSAWVVDTSVKFNYDDVSTVVKNAVEKYGVLGACNRKTCPLHKDSKGSVTYDSTEASRLTLDDHPFGYVIATDHEISYEKYAADTAGHPTTTLETKVNEDDETIHVYYNMKDWTDYKNETDASAYLPAGKTWTGGTTIASEDEKNTAAKAAKDNDLNNLDTLQKIWNTLFIPTSWLSTQARKDAYPTIEFGADVKTTSGTLDLAKLQTKFDEANVTPLWKGTDLATITSAWRPLNDNHTASCWVSLRCHWYHFTSTDTTKGFDGKTCTNGQYKDGSGRSVALYPDNPHDFPKSGDFNFDIHVANCQHVDLCDTCGDAIGTPGTHRLVRVSNVTADNDIEDADYRKAWIEILNHAEDLPGLADAVVVNSNLSVENWATGWSVLKATCHPGEDGYTVQICTGELDKILANLDAGKEWDDGIEWVKNSTTTVGNYAVDATEQPEHTYKVEYYYLDGTYICNEDTWTEFSDIICARGYYTQEVCQNKCRDGQTKCAYVKPETDGTKVDEYKHQPAGHTLAPIEDYQRFTDSYTKKTETKNAVMLQVCVVCGKTFTEEYGAKTPGDGTSREQYNVATPDQIAHWNEHVEAYNSTSPEHVLWAAQEVLLEDIATSNGLAATVSVDANGNLFANDRTFCLDNAAVTLKGTANIPATDSATQKPYSARVSVAKSKTLTFKKDTSATTATIRVEGTLTLVGEDKTAKVDFAELDAINVVGGTLVLQNLTVELGEDTTPCYINPLKGANVVLDGVTVKVKSSVFAMNANDAGENGFDGSTVNTITITNSILISTADNDFALTVWKKNVEVVATGSTFFGKQGGALIRAGKATFTNCTFLTATGATANDTWNDGSLIGAHAALVVGNMKDEAVRGDVTVTLNGCNFGVTTAENLEAGTPDPTKCDQTDHAISAYSSAVNSTTLTLDETSNTNAGDVDKHSGKTTGESPKDTLTVTVNE